MTKTFIVNADEYYLDDDMFDGNDDQIDGLKERLAGYVENARLLVAAITEAEATTAINFFRVLLSQTCEVADADVPYDHEIRAKGEN